MIPELEEIWKMLAASQCTLAEAQRWVERHIEMAREEAEQDQRDWFAGQALPHLLIQCSGDSRDATPYPEYVAKRAYEVADAMFKERDR